MKKRRTRWSDDMVREGIKDSMIKMNIGRMPTGDELKSIGRNDLHCRISRTKKYSGWAKDLGLELKSGSNTRKATKHEDKTVKWLESKGFEVSKTTHKNPYDLRVDDTVKVDVKVSSPYISRTGTKYIFAGMKGTPTCDLYILVTLDIDGTVKGRYVIPSHHVQQQTLNLREKTHSEYLDNCKLISKYSEFFSSI